MANIHVATDRIRSASQDLADLDYFCTKVRAAGHEVTNVGRGPNNIQSHMLSSSNACDVMVQIGGGLCLGTFVDFLRMTKSGAYHAKKAIIVYNMVANNLNAKTWITCRAHDDNFSPQSHIAPYVGSTLPKLYSENSEYMLGFVDGKNIEEVTTNFLKLLNGGSTDGGDTGGGGGSILELIKQACSGWRHYGPELILEGDTLTIRRTNPDTAKPMTSANILANSVSVTDYDSNTPNVNGSAKDQYLIDRFGQISVDDAVEDSNQKQILQVAQRGHNHSIDLKTIINPNFRVGNWVTLDLPDLNYSKRKYYITKSEYSEERVTGLTLEPAPPDIYVELEKVVDDETMTDETVGDETE